MKKHDPYKADARHHSFSQERHERLMNLLDATTANATEPPLRDGRRWVLPIALVATLFITGFFWLNGSAAPASEIGRAGAPVLLAERSLVTFQSSLEHVHANHANTLAEPTSGAVRFLSNQLSIARALAPATKSPA